ncbi:MAG TPA: type II secretion system minor pseudopilin GspI [Usitatibacter sp.]|nr:type II secretion system minor pseudopilin GspI [Usitatibacter sp.]
MKRRNGPAARRGRARTRPRDAGFTLIEILVAVAILAVALAATTRAAGIATDGARETRERLLATWAAENRIAELRARRVFPSAGTTGFATQEGGLALAVEETVSETPNPTLRRVDVAVAEAGDSHRVLARLTGYVAQ